MLVIQHTGIVRGQSGTTPGRLQRPNLLPETGLPLSGLDLLSTIMDHKLMRQGDKHTLFRMNRRKTVPSNKGLARLHLANFRGQVRPSQFRRRTYKARH